MKPPIGTAVRRVQAWWSNVWAGGSSRPAVRPPPDSLERSRAFERWCSEQQDRATWDATIDRAPMPDWAKGLLKDLPGTAIPDPPTATLQDGGLIVEIRPEPGTDTPYHREGGRWWAAFAVSAMLTPEAWPCWGIDATHRFTVPLAWFVRGPAPVAGQRVPPCAATAMFPDPAWIEAWSARHDAPFNLPRTDHRTVPVHGWCLTPIELAALRERWDLVERWGRQVPDQLTRSPAVLVNLGLRPWWGDGRWGVRDEANRLVESGSDGAARIARAWERVQLRQVLPEPSSGTGLQAHRSRPRL